MTNTKCTCGNSDRPGMHRFEGVACDKVPSIWSRMKRKIMRGTITIGRGKRNFRGEWSYGIELSLYSPQVLKMSPRFEIYCFKLIDYPPRGEMFKKGRDVRGLWNIIWWQPQVTLMQKKLYQRKGFRTRYVTVPIKVTGLFRIW